MNIVYIEEEIWKQLEDYPDYYFSSTGKIVSDRRKTPVYLKPIKTKEEYYKVNLYNKEGVRKQHRLHKLIYNIFVKETNKNKVIIHRDNNKNNNSWYNLICYDKNKTPSIREREDMLNICKNNGKYLVIFKNIYKSCKDLESARFVRNNILQGK